MCWISQAGNSGLCRAAASAVTASSRGLNRNEADAESPVRGSSEYPSSGWEEKPAMASVACAKPQRCPATKTVGPVGSGVAGANLDDGYRRLSIDIGMRCVYSVVTWWS